MTQFNRSLVWFRRDLRSFDHAALSAALTQSATVYCAFIFDRAILRTLPRTDRRVEFILACIIELDAQLRKLGGALIVRHADAGTAVPQLAAELGVDAVFANRDYEPAAKTRDADVAAALRRAGRCFVQCKDQVIFESDEVLTQAGGAYTVFTPYKNARLKRLEADNGDTCLTPYPVEHHTARLAPPRGGSHGSTAIDAISDALPSLADLGFEASNLRELRMPTGMSGGDTLFEDFVRRMPRYHVTRDFPAIRGPSYLSVHLRFGTVSIRMLARRAWDAIRRGDGAQGAAVWLSELIWRDFYFMILDCHPHVTQHAFKPAYDAICWESDAAADTAFHAWCAGRTGYPLIDAAMLQLNQSGYMHNRLRMATACFLIKDLGIDWRRGEHYFAERLNDFDLAANNGGWQWAASSGCDAQPYFRIFNPVTQSEKFDADGKFIRLYLPQLARLNDKQIHAPWLLSPLELAQAGIELGRNYPRPLVMHDDARKKTLERYAVVKRPGVG